MMAVQAISPQRHATVRWRRFEHYGFARGRHLVGLAGAEVAHAALSFPIAFIKQDSGWSLCAVLGLVPGENLYVGADGSWIASYVPASLRAHPFHLGWDGGKAVLCIEENSDLLVTDSSGEPIFDADGNLTAPVEQIWDFLSQTAKSLLSLESSCELLAEAGVIEPWPIEIRGLDGSHGVNGLHRIAEAKLNSVDDDKFQQLRKFGLIPIAYAQLISMGNLADLGKLMYMRTLARDEAEAAERAKGEVKPMITLPEDSSIDWDWSKIGR